MAGPIAAHADAHATRDISPGSPPGVRTKEACYCEHGNWQVPFIEGYMFQTAPGVLNLDSAAFYYFVAIGVTPAMEEKFVGRGSQYAWTQRNAKGEPLDGGKN